MPYYVWLINWTEQGIKNIKDSPKRAAAFRAAVEKTGGKVHGLYFTFGQYDIVGIGEAPSDEVAMSLALSVGSLGNVRTQTLKAWPESEAAKVIGKL